MRLFKFWMMTLVLGIALWTPAQAATNTVHNANKHMPLIKVDYKSKLNQGVRKAALVKFFQLNNNQHYIEQHIPPFLKAVKLDRAWVKGISPKSWKLGMALSSPGGVMGTTVETRITGKDLTALRRLILSEVSKQKKAK